MLLAGAGVGKSRLAREALAEAEHDGAVAMWVQATRSAASVPLGAFAGVIPAEVRSDDRFELLRGSTAVLSELAGERPLMIGVDDAQLLDPVSAALVLHVATAGHGFILATVRTGEPCPDAIVSLWKDAGAQRLELAQLDEPETSRLAESVVGGPVEEGVHRWIWDTSQGNPLYARELVLGALGARALIEVSGLWRMRSRPPLSASLTDTITARLAGLSGEEHRVLELLALGEPLGADDLIELVGSRGRGARPDHGGRARSQRPVPPLPPALRRDDPRRPGEAARIRAAAGAGHPPRGTGELTPQAALRVAQWRLDAAAPIPNEVLVDAARAANLSGDPDLGATLAERAVRAGAGLGATLLLARAHAIRKQFAEAEAVLAGLEPQLGTQDEASEYLEQRTAVLYWGLKRPSAAQELLERAQDWWPDRVWQRRLIPLRLHNCLGGGAVG